jgi:hypothetical protein
MSNRPRIAARVAGTTMSMALLAAPASAAQFQIKITNLSPNALSPAPFIAHDATFNLFDEGAPASAAIEAVAEAGNPAGVVSMAQAALGTSVADYAVAGAAPLTQNQSAMVTINTDMAHPWLSFASMMGISNDGFIGRATGDGAINLFPGGVPLNTTLIIMPSEVWDAGTEVNDELATTVGFLGGLGGVDEHGVITKPHPGILGIGDLPTIYNWTGGSVASIQITPEPASLLSMLAIGGAFLRRRR